MNSRVWSLTAITLTVCLASSILFVNSSFAEDSPARKAMKEKTAKYLEEKKKQAEAKKQAYKQYKLDILTKKLVMLDEKIKKNNSIATQNKIAEIKKQIEKLNKS